jgi:DME family drug/metabolite transporter
VTGVLWAAASGIGFGLFQTVNIRAVRQLDDAYVSTFLQVLVAAAVLALACAVAGDLALVGDLTPAAIANFAVAGLLHFFLGWTFLNLSQDRIGAARTAPLLVTVPLWGIVIAAATLGELPTLPALGGVAVMVAGALVVSSPARIAGMRWRDSTFAVATSFMWALSPIFTVQGLEEMDSPLLGVTLGVVFSALAYAALLAAWPGTRMRARRLPRAGVALKALGGVIVALATWSRWLALDLAAVGVVLSMNLLSVPVVLLLARLTPAGQAEQLDLRVWVGAALVVVGSLILIAVE